MTHTTDITDHEVADLANDAAVRPPVKGPEGVQVPVQSQKIDAAQVLDSADNDDSKLSDEELKQLTIGRLVKNEERLAGQEFKDYRHAAIKALPRFIINNSSNFLGFSHVLTEFAMFKASNGGKKLLKDRSNPINWVWEPIKNVYGEAFVPSKAKRVPFHSLEGNFFEKVNKFAFSPKAATERAWEGHLSEVAKSRGTMALSEFTLTNPWQTRSTLSGLIAWTLSVFIPDKKESAEEVERMAILRATNMPMYVAERFKQAVWFPEWPTHKRQMIGLGIMISGICSTMGAWRNSMSTPLGPVYRFNPEYLGTSAFTFLSSIPLMFASDEQHGFSGYGGFMMGRLAFLPGSVARKLNRKEPGAAWYLGATSSFQLENWIQALIGGAEKRPNPKEGEPDIIVDHNAEREAAAKKAAQIRQARRTHRNNHSANENEHAANDHDQAHTYAPPTEREVAEQPSPNGVKVTHREHAMPERKEAAMAV